jgi:peroxiredoxin
VVRGIAPALAAGILLVAVWPAPAADPGERPPSFTLEDLDGRPVSLSDFAGQVVSIHFFALWCEPCMQQLRTIEEVAARCGERGYQPLLVAVPHRLDRRRLWEHAKAGGLEIPVLLDTGGTVLKAYGVTGLPMNILVGRDGVVRYGGDSLPTSLLDEVSRLLAEKAR